VKVTYVQADVLKVEMSNVAEVAKTLPLGLPPLSLWIVIVTLPVGVPLFFNSTITSLIAMFDSGLNPCSFFG
jgi:hypothetical protein